MNRHYLSDWPISAASAQEFRNLRSIILLFRIEIFNTDTGHRRSGAAQTAKLVILLSEKVQMLPEQSGNYMPMEGLVPALGFYKGLGARIQHKINMVT